MVILIRYIIRVYKYSVDQIAVFMILRQKLILFFKFLQIIFKIQL